VVIFGSVFIKKSNETGFFKNRTETGSNRPVPIWFGFAWFFRFDSIFSSLAPFFSGLGSVQFSISGL
jgi:hypothetical protein